MTSTPPNCRQFGPPRFEDEREERIYRNIIHLGPGPQAFFEASLILLHNLRGFPAASHFVAHSMREIEGALRGVLYPLAEPFLSSLETRTPSGSPTSGDGTTHRQLVKAILQALKIDPDGPVKKSWLALTNNVHGKAHRKNLASPRSMEDILHLWSDFLTVLDKVLDRMQETFVNFVERLEELEALSDPNKKDLQSLLSTIPQSPALQMHFAQNAISWKWIPLLERKGFFSNPPVSMGIVDDAPSSNVLPWSATKLLLRFADVSEAHEAIFSAISSIPDVGNPYITDDLLGVLVALPPARVVPLIDRVLEWANGPNVRWLSNRLFSLAEHLANAKATNEALSLARCLLTLTGSDPLPERHPFGGSRPEPRALVDGYHYRHFLEGPFQALIDAAPKETLELLCEVLDHGLHLQFQSDDTAFEDWSMTWRPDIDGTGPEYRLDPLNSLVTAIRSTATSMVEELQDSVSDLVEVLEARKWTIFKRLAIHVLSLRPDRALKEVTNHLLDTELLNDGSLRTELLALAQAGFPHLSPADRTKFLDLIEKGPRELDPPREDSFREKWQVAWLHAIHEHLEGRWQLKYGELLQQYPATPEPLVDLTQWVGPTTPLSFEELAAFSPEELADFLEKWLPGKGREEPSIEGLARTLAAVVESGPARLDESARLFIGLGPTLVRGVLRGFEKRLRDGRELAWEPVLALCQWVTEQPRDMSAHSPEGSMDMDPHWGWARKAVGSLLAAGLQQASVAPPIGHRNQIWGIIEMLLLDPDPTPDDEAQEGSLNPATRSINTVRGQALHTAVHYGLWVRRWQETQGDSERRIKRGFDEMSELRQALDRHLDPSIDPSLVIRAAFGMKLPWLHLLDPAWAAFSLDQIFPQHNDRVFEAAWNSYVLYCRPYDSVIRLLEDCYRHAVSNPPPEKPDDYWLGDPWNQLAGHLATALIRGLMVLGAESPLTTLFTSGPLWLRKLVLQESGRLLPTQGPQPCEEYLGRVMTLWESRIDLARESDDEVRQELPAFGYVFASRHFDDLWSLETLFHVLELSGECEVLFLVVERLAETSEKFPLRTLRAFARLVELENEPELRYLIDRHAPAILGNAIATGETACLEAVKLANRLLVAGHDALRDLAGHSCADA